MIAILFAIFAAISPMYTAVAGTVVCTGQNGSAQMQCSSQSGGIYQDTDNISITCPCSDIVAGLSGTVKYLCQDGAWYEQSRTCQCTTCNTTSVYGGGVAISGGKREVYTISKKCQSGCVCGSDCVGSRQSYVCTCSSGYTVKNQGTSTCSCEENVQAGVCYVQYCNAGYYSTGASCPKCPNATGATNTITATSPAKNTGDINSCYIAKGTSGTDASGEFTYTANCPY